MVAIYICSRNCHTSLLCTKTHKYKYLVAFHETETLAIVAKLLQCILKVGEKMCHGGGQRQVLRLK